MKIALALAIAMGEIQRLEPPGASAHLPLPVWKGETQAPTGAKQKTENDKQVQKENQRVFQPPGQVASPAWIARGRCHARVQSQYQACWSTVDYPRSSVKRVQSASLLARGLELGAGQGRGWSLNLEK